ncbi:MAG: hypothetical protein MZV70_55785 [Desulfobacterales bacterium]|nr:hypothetical protein [Desulfobacterales bacterium]
MQNPLPIARCASVRPAIGLRKAAAQADRDPTRIRARRASGRPPADQMEQDAPVALVEARHAGAALSFKARHDNGRLDRVWPAAAPLPVTKQKPAGAAGAGLSLADGAHRMKPRS